MISMGMGMDATLINSDHFTVGGTLMRSLAGHTSLQPIEPDVLPIC